MRENFVFSAAVPLALAVFAFASCSSPALPENPEPIQETPVVPAGAGTLYVASFIPPSTITTGYAQAIKMEIAGNDLARGVLAISNIPHDNIAYDNEVHIINTNNKSFASLFFRENQMLPYKMKVTAAGEAVSAEFSQYDPLKRSFSVAFQKGAGDYYLLPGVTMNYDVFALWDTRYDFTNSQNARIRNMITALCVWDSIAAALPGSVFYTGSQMRAPVNGALQGPLAAMFSSMAVAAFAASVVPAQPAAVASVSGRLWMRVAIDTSTTLLWLSAWNTIHSDMPECVVFDDPSALPQKPRVIVTQGGSVIQNDDEGTVYRLFNEGDSVTFALQFEGGVNAGFSANPYIRRLLQYSSSSYSAMFFESVDNGDGTITIRKKASGWMGDGSSQYGSQYVINFDRDVVINGSDAGIMFQDSPTQPPRLRKDIFVIHFNTANAL